jgi:sugar phosphate isomerase/epimerase
MSCYISTGCFHAKGLGEIIALARKYRFDLELGSSLPFSSATTELIFKAKSRVTFLLHNYFPPPAIPFVLNLASSEYCTRNKSINLCMEAIGLSANIGVRYYSVHAGFAMEMPLNILGKPLLQGRAYATTKNDRGKAYKTFVEAIRKLAEFAAKKRVNLLVENNVLATENIADDGTFSMLLADVDEIKCFFNDLRRPEVGLLLDVGHAKVSAKTLQVDPQSYFDELKPFIKCLHLSDNDGLRDRNCYFSPQSWFVPYLKNFKHTPMVVEVYQSSFTEILAQRSLVMTLID